MLHALKNNLENLMKITRHLAVICCIAVLSGCFDSPDDQSTMGNTDGAKSSVQVDNK